MTADAIESVVDLCCDWLGKNGGVVVVLGENYKPITLGKPGQPITKKQIKKLVSKMIYYKESESIPEFVCEKDVIYVYWTSC